ncbi:MAG: transglutaminase domain-containing protein [Planctomycetes bacterium]|nr:transglutaminase domain-containing protein [Planctomycetota bacterium]
MKRHLLCIILTLAAACAAICGEEGKPPANTGEDATPENANDLTFNAIREMVASGKIGEAVTSYNRLLLANATTINRESVDKETHRWLLGAGYRERAIFSPLLEPKDTAYLENNFILSRISASVISGAKSEEERADRLFRFVTSSLLPYIPQPYLIENPVDVLVRGYGSCDQMAWVLCSLAEQAGIESMVVFLRDPATGKSPHTIAALRVNGLWQPYDPFTAQEYRLPKGERANLLKAIRNPSAIGQPTAGECLLIANNLPWAQLLIFTKERGVLPRWSLFSQTVKPEEAVLLLKSAPLAGIARLRADMAKAWGVKGEDLEKEMEKISTARVEKTGGAPISAPLIYPYGESIAQTRREADPSWFAKHAQSPAAGALRPVHLVRLTGNFTKALEELEKAVPNLPAEEQPLAKLVRAEIMQNIGNTEDAHAIFVELAGSSSPLAPFIWWNAAECAEKAGKKAEAAKLYRKVPEPRKAAALSRAEKLEKEQ